MSHSFLGKDNSFKVAYFLLFLHFADFFFFFFFDDYMCGKALG